MAYAKASEAMLFNASRSWAKRLGAMRGRSGKDAMISAHPQLPWNVQAEEKPSKTARKRAMHELQTLGERLVGLNPEQLAAIALPENLLYAVEQARRITKHEARRRQLQYIGRLMRALVRNAREERNAGRPPRAYRELFRALRDIIADSQPVPDDDGE